MVVRQGTFAVGLDHQILYQHDDEVERDQANAASCRRKQNERKDEKTGFRISGFSLYDSPYWQDP